MILIRKIIVISFLIIAVYCSSKAQSIIGITGGLSNSNFFGIENKDFYETDFTSDNNYTVSIFYKKQVGKKQKIGFELENSMMNSKMDIECDVGSGSFAHHVDYDLNYLRLYIIYENSIISNKHFNVSFNLSPYLGYLIHSHAEGSGWGYGYDTYIDSSGNSIPYISIISWEKDESQTEDICKMNVGLRLGVAVEIPLYEKISVFVNNSYNFNINNVLKVRNAYYTSIRSIYLTCGLVYKLGNKTKP